VSFVSTKQKLSGVQEMAFHAMVPQEQVNNSLSVVSDLVSELSQGAVGLVVRLNHKSHREGGLAAQSTEAPFRDSMQALQKSKCPLRCMCACLSVFPRTFPAVRRAGLPRCLGYVETLPTN
jgi:hypothetical protein